MNRRIVAALLSAIVLALLAACSGAPGEATGSAEEATLKCLPDDDCSLPPPPKPPVKTSVADAAPPPPPDPFPGCTPDMSNAGGNGKVCDGVCAEDTSCWFSPTGVYLSDAAGNLPGCTDVFYFNAGGNLGYLAYCLASSRVSAWVLSNKEPNLEEDGGPLPDYTPFGASQGYTMASLPTLSQSSGYVYVTFDETLPDVIIKCKLGGVCLTPGPIVGTGG